MALRNDINGQTKTDVSSYNSAVDGQAFIVLGEAAMGDFPTRVYYYDINSTATADGENVLTATGMAGGRFIKLPLEGANPPGSLVMWAAAAAPATWLLCDGSAVSRTTYFNLFNNIGTTYGVGDGSTTFNLPDLRQRFPLGKATAGTGANLADSGGLIDHIHSVDPPNTTTNSAGTHNHTGVTGAPSATVQATILAGGAASTTHTHTITSDGAHTHDVNISAFNSASANPPFLVINFIIKT